MNRPTQYQRPALGLEKPSLTLRRPLNLLLAVAVCLQTSCAVPVRPDNLAQPDKRSLGRVALVAARFDPNYQFEALTAGKGEGAAKGAGAGALSCAELMQGTGGSTGIGAGFVVLVFLLCLPVGATVGAIHGATHAASEKQIEQAKAAAQREIAALSLQSETVGAVLRYGKEMGLAFVQLERPVGPVSPDELPSYKDLADIADSVIEISILHAKAFTTGGRELRVSLGMLARVRVVGVQDGKVIDSLIIKHSSIPRTIEEWVAANGSLIKTTFDQASASIAEQSIDEILLIYHPNTLLQPSPETTGTSQVERVPPYALRAITPPIRNKTYWNNMTYGHLERYPLSGLQPSFRWEAWPRGFDIVRGNGKGQANQVRYDFRIYDDAGVAYERNGIVEPQHRLDKALAPCQTYRWTVRARFMLNDAPRATEWMGAYDTMGGTVAPWWWRRGSGVPALAAVPDSVLPFYPIIESPSVFGTACTNR